MGVFCFIGGGLCEGQNENYNSSGNDCLVYVCVALGGY